MYGLPEGWKLSYAIFLDRPGSHVGWFVIITNDEISLESKGMREINSRQGKATLEEAIAELKELI